MQIHGSVQVHGPQPINAPHHSNASRPTAPTETPAQVDQLDISEEAQAVSKALEAAPIRQDRVAEIRAQITQGTYETSEKLEAAVDRLLDEIG